MITFYIGNVFTAAQTERGEEKQAIYDCLSYKVKGHEYMQRKMGRRWGGTASFFDKRREHFLTGLLGKVCAYVRALGMQYQIYDTRVNPSIEPAPVSLRGITLYDYQERAVRDFLKSGRGVIKLPTGAGKTEVATAITQALDTTTLFLTHRVNLLHQTAERFAKRLPASYKSKIGIIGNGQYSPRKINFATVQTLDSMLKRYPAEITGVLEDVKLLLIDEAHRSGSAQFYKPALLCRDAYYRGALTATPFMKDCPEEDMYLMGISAGVCASVSNLELIERGILARPLFRFIDIDAPDGLRGLRDWRDIYERGIVENDYRNQVVRRTAKDLVALGRKILVIVTEVEHGKRILAELKKHGMKAEFVAGKDDYRQRTIALKELAKGKLDIIVCTNIFDEGIDVHEIDTIILAAGTKSAPALFQRTGRAVRKKEDGGYALIVDFIDRQHPKLYDHSVRRYNLIKREKGFTII